MLAVSTNLSPDKKNNLILKGSRNCADKQILTRVYGAIFLGGWDDKHV